MTAKELYKEELRRIADRRKWVKRELAFNQILEQYNMHAVVCESNLFDKKSRQTLILSNDISKDLTFEDLSTILNLFESTETVSFKHNNDTEEYVGNYIININNNYSKSELVVKWKHKDLGMYVSVHLNNSTVTDKFSSYFNECYRGMSDTEMSVYTNALWTKKDCDNHKIRGYKFSYGKLQRFYNECYRQCDELYTEDLINYIKSLTKTE